MTCQKIFEIPPKPGTSILCGADFHSNFHCLPKKPFLISLFKPSPKHTHILRHTTSQHKPYLDSLCSLSPKTLALPGIAMKGGKSKGATNKTDAKLKSKSSGRINKKAAKDPNKPKRPASAFFVFMEDFRQQFKEKHPNNKSVATVGKAGGDKWKSLTEAEKAPFVAKAEKRKAEYNKNMAAYNKRMADGGNADDESDKSKSEVNDEEEEEGESAEEEEDDDE